MEVKDKILKVARVEFARLGFKNVRTDELAHKIGISKRTLYENFQSKEQLFEEVIDLDLNNIKVTINDIIERTENNPEVNLIDEIKRMWQINVDSSLKFTKDFFSDLQKFTPHIWEKIAVFRQKEMEANFVRIFNIGKKQGIFKPELNTDILFFIHITTVQHMLSPDVILKMNVTPQEIVDTIYKVTFTGILTDNAREYYQSQCKPFCITNSSIIQ